MNSYSTAVVTTVVAALTLLSGAAVAGAFGPSNYDECILEHMKGVGSDLAAAQLVKSCERQFPPKAVPATVVSPASAPPKTQGQRAEPGEPASDQGRFTDFVPYPVK